MKLENFRKLGKNVKFSKKRTLPTGGQNLIPQWCPLIRDYTVVQVHASAGRDNSVRTGTKEDPGWGVPARI